MQGGVKRTLFHFKKVLRGTLNHLGNRVLCAPPVTRVRRIIMSSVPFSISTYVLSFLVIRITPLEHLWKHRIHHSDFYGKRPGKRSLL
jgi:hypothetical protein